MRRPQQLAALAVVCLALIGCTSQGVSRALTPNDRLRDQVEELKQRVLELQRQSTVGEVELARLQERVVDLEAELAAARDQLVQLESRHRSPVRVDEEPIAPSAPPGPLEEHDVVEPVELTPSQTGAGADSGADEADASSAAEGAGPTPVAPEAQQLYDEAYTLFHRGEFIESETLFQRFLQRWQDTDLADNALYWIGESRYSRGDFRGALAAFREVVNRYPDANKTPDALLKAGSSLEQLGDVDGARESYREIQRRFPDSANALVAAERISRLP